VGGSGESRDDLSEALSEGRSRTPPDPSRRCRSTRPQERHHVTRAEEDPLLPPEGRVLHSTERPSRGAPGGSRPFPSGVVEARRDASGGLTGHAAMLGGQAALVNC